MVLTAFGQPLLHNKRGSVFERFRILSIGHFRYQRETLFILRRQPIETPQALLSIVALIKIKMIKLIKLYNYTKILFKINKLNQKLVLKYGLYTVTVNMNKILKHEKNSHAENLVFKRLPLLGLFGTFDMLSRKSVWV